MKKQLLNFIHRTYRSFALLAMLVACLIMGSAISAAVPTTLYMSPVGNDTNNGTTSVNAVKTLARIHEILMQTNPTGPVEVRIRFGTYSGQKVEWTFFNGNPITFTPRDDQGPTPVFDGNGSGTWFILKQSAGVDTQITFRKLQIQNYGGAISFEGNRDIVDPSNGWNGSNELDGMVIRSIGNKYYPANPPSTAAVRLLNSRNNLIRNSRFEDIENDPGHLSALHAIYVAHRSSNNLIENNIFTNISGDAVRIRDSSDYNQILTNTFTRVGKAAYSEWFCDYTRGADCTATFRECPSFGNAFRYNIINSGYDGGGASTFVYYQSLDLSCPRLSTAGNVNNS